MDHPRGSVGAFKQKVSDTRLKRFGCYSVKTTTGRQLFRHGLRLSPGIQSEEQLLNCSAWVAETVTPDDPWDALKCFLRGKPDWPS